MAEQLQGHFWMLKPAKDHSKETEQIPFNDTSVGFIPKTPKPVEASCVSHSYVISSLLGHILFRENSQQTRRTRLLLGASLSLYTKHTGLKAEQETGRQGKTRKMRESYWAPKKYPCKIIQIESITFESYLNGSH